MRVRASRRPLSALWLLGCSSGILLGLSMTVAARDPTPLPASPKSAPAATVADWRLQMVDRIEQAKAFPASGYCKEGLVKVSFRIDRTGKLLASEVSESSQVPAFDAEALAILKRAQPFPPPPEDVTGDFVSLSVPIRFRQEPLEAGDERQRYLNLKGDLTLTLDGAPVDNKELVRAITATTKSDRIIICSDENVPPEQLSAVAEQVKAAGAKFTVSPRPDPKSD
jgi:TonB family protein